MKNHGNNCQDCGITLDENTQKNPDTLSTLCDTCDWRDRDNLAYMLGTGRWSQG